MYAFCSICPGLNGLGIIFNCTGKVQQAVLAKARLKNKSAGAVQNTVPVVIFDCAFEIFDVIFCNCGCK